MSLGSIARAGRVAAAALLVLGAGSASAWAIRVEAEYFVAAHNIVPNDITVSNGVLYGLDYGGEWTQYTIPAVPAGAYAASMRCWGILYTPYHMQLVLESPPWDTQTVDLRFTGLGTCGA